MKYDKSGKGEGAYLFMIFIILSDNTRRGKRETVDREVKWLRKKMYCISRMNVNTRRNVKMEVNLCLVIGVIIYKVSDWGREVVKT